MLLYAPRAVHDALVLGVVPVEEPKAVEVAFAQLLSWTKYVSSLAYALGSPVAPVLY